MSVTVVEVVIIIIDNEFHRLFDGAVLHQWLLMIRFVDRLLVRALQKAWWTIEVH